MNFLIVYGTTEGQTRKIAEFVADRIAKRGHTIATVDATSEHARELTLREFDGVIVAASLHAGIYQAAIEAFVRKHHETLNSLCTAFFSVSLGAASEEPSDVLGVNNCVERFVTATGWRPGAIHHIAGAFRYTQYDFFKRWAMRAIAHQKGVTGDAGHDLEMTNWSQVALFTDAFVVAVAKLRGVAANANPPRAAEIRLPKIAEQGRVP